MTPVFIGGTIRYFIEKKARPDEEMVRKRNEQGILLGSGLIAGEGIIGVLIAAYAFFAGLPKGIGLHWGEVSGQLVSLAVFALLALFLVRKTRLKGGV
jgi:hypothetical protein